MGFWGRKDEENDDRSIGTCECGCRSDVYESDSYCHDTWGSLFKDSYHMNEYLDREVRDKR
jgi:hypothetical protein